MVAHGSPKSEEAAPPRAEAAALRLPFEAATVRLCLVLAALAAGRSRIEGLPAGSDAPDLQKALCAMGARIARAGDALVVDGVGAGCLLDPAGPLAFADAGSALLALGLVAPFRFEATVTCRAAAPAAAALFPPLRAMGARVQAGAPGDALAVTLRGPRIAAPLDRRLDAAEAPLLPALLLAALSVPGVTTLTAPAAPGPWAALFAAFGAALAVETAADGSCRLRLQGQGRLAGCALSFGEEPAPPR